MSITKVTSTLALAGTLLLPGTSLAATGDLVGSLTGTVNNAVTTVGGVVNNTVNSATNGGLVNVGVNGNSVNVNPAVCANTLSSGNCTATATQTVTQTVTSQGEPGRGGGTVAALGNTVAGTITPAAAALPRTGAEYMLFLLSFGGALAAAGASFIKQRVANA